MLPYTFAMTFDLFRLQIVPTGRDAHTHVLLECQHKPPGTALFGTKEQFEEAQKKRRLRQLRSHLHTLGNNIRVEVLKAIEAHLQGFGLDEILVEFNVV